MTREGLLLAVLVFALAGCDDSASSAGAKGGPLVRDSAGIEIVELGPVRYEELPQWRLGDPPLLDIGLLEGPEPYMLYHVADARVLPSDHRIVLINDHEIRMFDSAGVHLWSQGQRGDGPGSYRNPWRIRTMRGDTLIVSHSRAFTVLGPGGEVVRRVTPDSLAGNSGSEIVGVTATGDVLVWDCSLEWHEWSGYNERRIMCDSFVSDLAGRFRFALGRRLRDRLMMHPSAQWLAEQPWQQETVVATGPEGTWYGSGDAYELWFYRGSPPPSRIVRWEGPDLTVTEEDIRSYDQRIESQDRPSPAKEFEKSIPKPGHLPPYRILTVDGLGRLWLLDYERSDRGPPGPNWRWTILSADGSVALARFEHSRESRPMDAGDGWVLLWELDELEVEHVRIYPIVEW